MTAPTVVLIAAGAATRLGALTEAVPKILLEVAPGKTVLDCQIQALERVGVRDVVIIVGFQARQIMAHVASLKTNITVRFAMNPFYRVSNNLASVWLGLKDLRGSVVTVNGDNLFTAAAVEQVMRASGDIVMTTSAKDGYDDDDMKVVLDNHSRVVAVGKQLDPQTATGESVGMFRFSEHGLGKFVETMTSMLTDEPATLNQFYLAAIQRLVDAGEPVSTVAIGADEWRELDFPEDLQRIRTDIQDGTLAGWPFSSQTSLQTQKDS